MTKAEEILEAALGLDDEARARMADMLLASLGEELGEDDERLWAEVASRRMEEIRLGTSSPVAAEDVFRKAEKLLA